MKGQSKSARHYRRNRASAEKKKAYDKAYHSTPERRRYRAALNRKNRENGTYGNGDGKDFDHAVNKMVDQSTNRGRNSRNRKSTSGDRRARG